MNRAFPHRLLAICAVTAAAGFTLAQDTPEPAPPSPATPHAYLKALHGTWTGDAKLFGQAVHTTATWEAVLSDKFTRLELTHRQSTAEGPEMFAGHAYLSRADEGATSTGHWFDSSGAVRPQRLRVDDGALVVDWGSSATEIGRSTYTLREDGTLAVRDWVQRDGGYHPFGGGVLTRE